MHNRLGNVGIAHEDLIHRVAVIGRLAEHVSEVALGVEVDAQHASPARRNAR